MDQVRAVANRSGRHLQIVRHIAHILDSDKPAAQVKRVLRTYLNRLKAQAPHRGRGAHTGHFVDHLEELAARYWPGLFHTYDDPRIPRTSNAIEGLFGSIKRAVRSTSGRASTAGGKMETCGELAVGAEAITRSLPKDVLTPLLEAVPDDAYQAGRRKLLHARAPARQRRSIQRDLQAFLDRALNSWRAPPATS